MKSEKLAEMFHARAREVGLRTANGRFGEPICLSILPPGSNAGLTGSIVAVLSNGDTACFCNSAMPVDILDAMHTHRVTVLASSPEFLNVLKRAVRHGVDQQNGLRRALCRAAFLCSSLLPLPARRLVFRKVCRRLGGRLRCIVSDGVPLDDATLRFFRSIGFPVYEATTKRCVFPLVKRTGAGASAPKVMAVCRAALARMAHWSKVTLSQLSHT